MNPPLTPGGAFTAICLLVVLLLPTQVQAAPPDLTASGVIAALKTDPNSTPLYEETYNLGATGLRGWIYIGGGSGADGTFTGESRQILVTVASTPGSAVLAVDDVILGAMAASTGTVPVFTSDCRKAFGVAIGDAEKTGAGTLRVKRWRAGTTTDVNISMTIMGNYTATAPYSCPKSSLILANARNKLVGDLLANSNFLTIDWTGAIKGLALLAGVQSGDPNYATVQTRLQTYARALAARTPNQSDYLYIWQWAYENLFLSEYYLSTNDANVVTGINNYTLALAKAQSRYGTYNHTGALLKADGSLHGTCPPYGPVNQVGIAANIAIVMGKKALVAASQTIDSEIDPAIQRGADFFRWYVNKGPIPYGEHGPYMENHSSNGKDALCAVLFGLQAGRTTETEYFTRMTTASFNAREDGHTGQGFNYLWGGMGANMGGSLATAEYLKPVRWHLDLERRTDGSFVYDGKEGHGGGTTAGGTYLGASSYYGMNPTASYILTYALPLKRLYITGKNAISANTLDSTKVADAIASATFKQDSPGLTSTQLIAALSHFDPVVRNYAAIELAKRTLTGTEANTLIAMINDSNANARQGACQTLGILQNATALPLISERLSDTDVWVRAKAATALRNYTSTAASAQLTPMLTAFTANATDPEVIVWTDPIQISNGFLSLALFGNGVPDGSPGNNVAAYTKNATKNLLYPAVKAGLKQPDSYTRLGAAKFVESYLSLADIQELALDIFELITTKCQADAMWHSEPQLSGIKTLQKFNCAEGLPMALSMLDVKKGWGHSSTNYLPPPMATLVSYGDLARWTLPVLNDDIFIMYTNLAASDYNTIYPQMVSTIASINNATTSPTGLINLLPLATSQVVVTTEAKAITLAGTSPRSALTFTNVSNPAHGTLTGSPPNLTYTPNSGYTGPDSFTFKVVDSLTTSEAGTVSVIVGTAGTGLKGEYFDNADFTNLKLTRTDSQVNFDWGTGTPDPLISADTFSVRWTGMLLVPETGSYTFSTLNSDGVRLYINGVAVIDNFVDQTTHWNDSATVNLTAGQVVNLKLDYYKNTGSAVAKLKWIGPSFAGVNGLPIAKEWLFDGASVPNNTTYTWFTWLNAASGNLSLASNWASGVAPAAGGQSAYNLNFTPSGTYTVTHNLNNGFQLNQLNVAGAVTFAGTNSLAFTSIGSLLPQFNQNSSNTVIVDTPLSLGAMTTFGGISSGAVTISSLISGAGGLTQSGAGTLQIYGLTPNTYAGGTVINNGTLHLGAVISGVSPTVVNPVGSGSVTLNDGTIRFDNVTASNSMIVNGGTLYLQNGWGATWSGPITLNGDLTCDNLYTMTCSGNISGTGGLIKKNAGSLVLSGTNTFNGTNHVTAGTLSCSKSTSLGTGILNITTGAKVALNYTGTRTIASLSLGGAPVSPGTYGSTASTATHKNDTYFSGTGTVTAGQANRAPVATAQSVSTPEDTAMVITLTGTDLDGNPLTYSTLPPQPSHGNLTGTPPNVTYTPDSNYYGPDSFTFKANDGVLDSAPATISITVTPVNDAPVPTPQSVTVWENTAKAITLTGTDVEGDPLTYTIVTQPASGAVSTTGPNETYTPATNFTGVTSFTFSVNDGTVNSITNATVTITVIEPETTFTGALSTDWNTAGNWDLGLPTGSINMAIAASATANNASATPAISPGKLTLNSGSAIIIPNNAASGETNVVTTPSSIEFNGGTINIQSADNPLFSPLTMTGSGKLTCTNSSGDSKIRTINNTISGSGPLTIEGRNKQIWNIGGSNSSFSGDLALTALDRYEVRFNAVGSAGTGNVTVTPRAADGRSGVIVLGANNIFASTATLTLNGKGTDSSTGWTYTGVTAIDMKTFNATVKNLYVLGVQMPAGNYTGGSGTWITGTGILTVNASGVASAVTYDTWKTSYPALSNSDARVDFDKGGLPTGIERVLGGDPTNSSDDASITPTWGELFGSRLFIFRRSDTAYADGKTTIAVEYSGDFVNWTTATPGTLISISEQNDGFAPGVDRVTVSFAPGVLAGNTMFVRLKVAVSP